MMVGQHVIRDAVHGNEAVAQLLRLHTPLQFRQHGGCSIHQKCGVGFLDSHQHGMFACLRVYLIECAVGCVSPFAILQMYTSQTLNQDGFARPPSSGQISVQHL